MSEIGTVAVALFFALILAVCFGIVLRIITQEGQRAAFDIDAEMARYVAGLNLERSGTNPKK